MEIYSDLRKSPFRFYAYGMVFHFSSEAKYRRFKKFVDEEVSKINGSLRRRFRCECDVGQIALVREYSNTETNGFFIETESGEALCRSDLVFVGEWQTKTGFEPQSGHTIPPLQGCLETEPMLG